MRQRYERDGFVVLDSILEVDEVPGLVAIVDRLVETLEREHDKSFQDLTGPFGRTVEGAAAVAQVMAPHVRAPELLDAPLLQRATDAGRELLGDGAVTSFAMVIAKPAQSPGVVPWHQDAAYWGHDRRVCGASIWVPLQDVDESNGCLSFVGGSHRGEVRPHRHFRDDPTVHALELAPELVDDETVSGTAQPLRVGQATVHDGHLLHFSGPNRTDRPRRALVLSVRNPARDVSTPDREPFPWA